MRDYRIRHGRDSFAGPIMSPEKEERDGGCATDKTKFSGSSR